MRMTSSVSKLRHARARHERYTGENEVRDYLKKMRQGSQRRRINEEIKIKEALRRVFFSIFSLLRFLCPCLFHSFVRAA
jgi:hypothetical protein